MIDWTQVPEHSTYHKRAVDPADGRKSPDGEKAQHDWLQGVEGWIGQHPAVCLGAAMVAGVALGWLIKRR